MIASPMDRHMTQVLACNECLLAVVASKLTPSQHGNCRFGSCHLVM